MNTAPAPLPPREDDPGYRLAEAAAWWILSRRGEEVAILDLRGRSDVCDYFVLATGAVEVQVRAVCDAVAEGLGGLGHPLHHAEGLEACRWGLLDFVDVIVHVFQPAARQYYLIERLWGDAPRIAIDDGFFAAPSVRQRHAWLAAPAAGSAPPQPRAGDA